MGNGCNKSIENANNLFSLPTISKSKLKDSSHNKKQGLVGKISNFKELQGGKKTFTFEIVKLSDVQNITGSTPQEDTGAFFTDASPFQENLPPAKETKQAYPLNTAQDNKKRSSINSILPLNRISTPNFLINKLSDKNKSNMKNHLKEDFIESVDENVSGTFAIKKESGTKEVSEHSKEIDSVIKIPETEPVTEKNSFNKSKEFKKDESPMNAFTGKKEEEKNQSHEKVDDQRLKHDKEEVKLVDISEALINKKDITFTSEMSTAMVSKANKSCIIQMNDASNKNEDSILDTSLVYFIN